MIEHKYRLRSEDHIFAQLYKYSKNKTQNKKDKQTFLSSTFYSLLAIFLVNYFTKFNYPYTYILFLIIPLYFLVDYFFFRKRRIEKHFTNYVSSLNSSNFNTQIQLKIDSREIYVSSYSGYSVTYLEHLENVTNFKNLIFLNFKDESRYIVKATDEEKHQEILSYFEELKVPVIDKKDWKW